MLDWTAGSISEENHAWLRSLPYAYRFGEISFTHGAPLRPEAYEYIFALEQLDALMPHFKELADVTFLGHSHMSKIFAFSELGEQFEIRDQTATLQRGLKYVISVGSVGQPRDYDSRACFTVYDTIKRTVQFQRVEYDINASAQKIFGAGLALNFGKRLYLGI